MAEAKSAFSMCSGVGTAEAARAVVQKTVNSDPSADPFNMNIETVALWEPVLHGG